MQNDDSRIDGQTIKAKPAGSIDPEQNWSVPTEEYVQSWLGEARAKFREHRHARAVGRVVEAHTMQRIIRLVMRIDTEREAADHYRTERDEYRDSAITLRQQLDEAEAEIVRLKDAAQANADIMRSEQETLKIALGHLEKVWQAAQDADNDFNFREEGIP